MRAAPWTRSARRLVHDQSHAERLQQRRQRANRPAAAPPRTHHSSARRDARRARTTCLFRSVADARTARSRSAVRPIGSLRLALRTRRRCRRGSVIGSDCSRIALGERQSAAVMQIGIHTCFQTTLASHREPAMPAYQGAQPSSLVRAAGASAEWQRPVWAATAAARTRDRRVGRAPRGARPPSEPDVPVSRHPAQASPVGW
jgi:hypothetical protein